MWRNVAGLLAGVTLAAGGCRETADEDAAPAPPVPGSKPPPVYVAVGASESVGVGADRPFEQAWPQVLYRTALPPGSRFVNLGIPGATVADALRLELPQALEQRPTLVTVWLNVNDIIRGVPPEVYERQLGELVHALRRDGATRVLVANTPDPGILPVLVACRSAVAAPASGTGCPATFAVPWLVHADSVVDAYNAAIATVAWREGAVVVDLHAAALAAQRAGTAPALVSGDGFHPSTAGHLAVAELFADALEATGGA